MRGSAQTPRTSPQQGSNWELDADELDRYMSGQPPREPRFDPYGRSQSSGQTERAPQQRPRQQPAQPLYEEDYETAQAPDSQWVDDDYGYENEEYGYEEYQPEPAPPRRRSQSAPRQPRQSNRTRQYAPEADYDDDLYDDPYVLDDDEAPQRPQRRPQRQNRARQPRQSASFSLPPVIAEAPIIRDRLALSMMGVGLVSVLAMVIIVMTQQDSLNELIFTHVNANGDPENLRESDAIWNLPLIAGMVFLISGILAWFLARWGEFLPRFLLGGAIGVQFVVWIAVIAYLF